MMNDVVQKIRNGDAAKSPLFIFSVLGINITLLSTFFAGGLWVSSVNSDLDSLMQWNKAHIADGPHGDVPQILLEYKLRLEGLEEHNRTLEQRTEDRWRGRDMANWCLRAERANSGWTCPEAK